MFSCWMHVFDQCPGMTRVSTRLRRQRAEPHLSGSFLTAANRLNHHWATDISVPSTHNLPTKIIPTKYPLKSRFCLSEAL